MLECCLPFLSATVTPWKETTIFGYMIELLYVGPGSVAIMAGVTTENEVDDRGFWR